MLPTSQALNRRSAETAMNRALPTYRSFHDIEAAKAWMDLNQLGRRNLTKEKRDEMIRRLASSGRHTQKEIAQAVGLTKMRINQIVNESGSKETLQVPNVTNSDLTVTAKLKDEVESMRRRLEEAEAARRSTEQRLSAVQSDLKLAKMALDLSSYPGIPEHSLPV